jgi:PRTRC genetic system protein B
MTNITNSFGTLFHPQKAFVIFEQQGTAKNIYVESYDIDPQGRPINAHPLSLLEANKLCKALQTKESKRSAFLALKGLMPSNLLYLRTDTKPFAIWHTPQQRVNLYFKKDLGIKSGICEVPALVWRASGTSLALFALTDSNIETDTPLYNAPFFNIYNDGHVCMGNVQINIKKDCPLEGFIQQWQNAFFNSYFSHMIQGYNPIKGNIVQLWKSLSGKDKAFPSDKLIPTHKTIRHLIQ